MKTTSLLLTLFAGAGLFAAVAWAGLPQPMCVYYGQARDGYGQPYRTNAEVILLRGTNIIARQTVRGSLTPGVNFALYVHLDDGSSTRPYSARALRSGEMVSIVVHDADGQKTIMEQQVVPPVGEPGELIAIDATAATDVDGDGLPDQWEQDLIAWSGGALHSLSDVRPEDDFDGDGMSNLQEYRAGTFAFLDYDYLFIEYLSRTSNNRLQLTFLSMPGKVYSVTCTTNVMQSSWDSCFFALSDTEPFQKAVAEGNGDWLSIYIPTGGPTWFFRIEAR